MQHFDQIHPAGEVVDLESFGLQSLAPRIADLPVVERKPREVRIRESAFLLWEGAGRPTGRQDEHWLQAVAEIDAEDR